MPAEKRKFLSPLHRAVRQVAIHLGEAMQEIELSGAEGHLLSFLTSYSPTPISTLHQVFGHKRSTLTSMLDRLERRGLIRREVHPEDRRSFLVHLTEAGRTMGIRVNEHIRELEEQIEKQVSEVDVEGFRRVTEAIGDITQVCVRPEDPK